MNPTGDSSLCSVGLRVAGKGSQQILGDSFLRAAYVVFDWDNEEVHIAQGADCGSEIVAIGSGSDAVPSVTGACETTPASRTSASTSSSGVSRRASPTSDPGSQTTEPSLTPSGSQDTADRSEAQMNAKLPIKTIISICIAACAVWEANLL